MALRARYMFVCANNGQSVAYLMPICDGFGDCQLVLCMADGHVVMNKLTACRVYGRRENVEVGEVVSDCRESTRALYFVSDVRLLCCTSRLMVPGH